MTSRLCVMIRSKNRIVATAKNRFFEAVFIIERIDQKDILRKNHSEKFNEEKAKILRIDTIRVQKFSVSDTF